MKYCVVIMDGASGWPLDELGGRTTLAAAKTPNLDTMASTGSVGLSQTVPEVCEPSSAVACMAILGYDPVANAVGRGAIEAASMGIELADDEIALRVNLVNTDGGVMASYSCGHISTAESREIIGELNAALENDTFRFYPGVGYRSILVVKGHPELIDVVCSPPHDMPDESLEGHMPSGQGSQVLLDLMDKARAVLASSPVNSRRRESGEVAATDIWPCWPGAAPKGIRPFSEIRLLSAAMTSAVDLLNGLAVLTRIDRLDIPGVTDGPDNDYAAQVEGALAALEDHDVVFIHIEAPDEAGHAGDVAGKIEAIEAIDREVVGRLLAYDGDLRILCMPDHATPIESKTHVSDPVPFVAAGGDLASIPAKRFDEESAKAQRWIFDPGRGALEFLLA